jgi:hypothetical protein
MNRLACFAFATQGSDHYHTIGRDRSTDYGAELSDRGTDATAAPGPYRGN